MNKFSSFVNISAQTFRTEQMNKLDKVYFPGSPIATLPLHP